MLALEKAVQLAAVFGGIAGEEALELFSCYSRRYSTAATSLFTAAACFSASPALDLHAVQRARRPPAARSTSGAS